MNNLKNKTFLIFGTGAVGAYYGGMLFKHGYDVTFIARGKNYEVIKEKGLKFIVDDKEEILPIKIFNSTKDLGTFDYIVICTKSMDTKNAIEQIKCNIGPDTTVLSFQNGIENEELLISELGKEKTIGAFVYIASQLIEPGILKMLGNNTITIGEFDGEKTRRILDLQKIFQNSEITCLVPDDINAELWNKLVWNTAFNSISTLTEKTLDQILNDKELYKEVKNIMIEVRDVAIAHKIKIRTDTVEFNLERSKGYTGFKTSTLQDYERGKPLEIDALVGIVIKKAKEKNIKVPNIERMYSQLKDKVKAKTKV